MKKITLLIAFLVCTLGFSQTFTDSGGPYDMQNGNGGTAATCGTADELTLPLAVTGVGVLGTTNVLESVTFNASHSWNSDIQVELQDPSGATTVLLIQGIGGSGDGFTDCILQDGAGTPLPTAATTPVTGTFDPLNPLSAFTGVDADGTWNLLVCDSANGDVGTVDSWSLTFAPAPACIPAVFSLSLGSDNCPTEEFFIDVDITNLGSASSVNILNDGGASAINGVDGSASPYSVGPFPAGTDVQITVEDASDGTCNDSDNIVTPAVCPPANDECVDAESIACGDTVMGSTVGATNSGNNSSNDVWYELAPVTAGYEVIVSLCDLDDYDTYLRIFDSCGGTQIYFNDDSCGVQSEITFTSDGTTTYYIMVEGFSGNNGDYTLTVTCTPPPTCDIPTGITITPAAITADFSWTAPASGTPVGYNWEIQPDGVAQGTAGAITGNTVDTMDSASGLTESTAYDLYIQTDCDTDGTSAWDGPYSFTTTFLPPACGGTFYDTGGPSGNYSPSESNSTTITPTTPGDAVTITFTYVDIETSTGAGNQDGCWDFLTIYNGPDNTYPVLAQTLCGEESGDGGVPSVPASELNVGDSFTSTDPSGALTIEFSSDTSVNETGWEANVTCATLSTESYSINELFSYYPNPVSSTLTLKGQYTIQDVVVYNMMGQVVMKSIPNTAQSEVDMSSLQTGAYFVKVTVENETKTIRIIKN